MAALRARQQAARKHGAEAADVIPAAEAHARELISEHTHLTASDRLAVRSLAIAEERVQQIAAWLEEHGDFDGGDLRPAVDKLRQWLSTAQNARARLGLDPMSRAALAVDELNARRAHADLAAADLAEGRRLRKDGDRG